MAGAGEGEGPGSPRSQTPGTTRGGGPRAGPDWAGLPEHLLMKVAGKVVAQTEAGWTAKLKEDGFSEGNIQDMMGYRKRNGNCLFIFARVCKPWWKAQLKVGGKLRTRVKSDVIAPGRVGLVKWALAEGCPREDEDGFPTMVHAAAEYGHLELVKWLCGEGGLAMDDMVMMEAAGSGNLELVQWMRGEGCEWDLGTCLNAVAGGHVEVLRWLRENGCAWTAHTRDGAKDLGYTDNFGNLVM